MWTQELDVYCCCFITNEFARVNIHLYADGTMCMNNSSDRCEQWPQDTSLNRNDVAEL